MKKRKSDAGRSWSSGKKRSKSGGFWGRTDPHPTTHRVDATPSFLSTALAFLKNLVGGGRKKNAK